MRTKQSFIKSILNAIKGLYAGIAGHRNIQIMLLICVVVITSGIYYHITRFEWAVIWICMGMVIALELVNTSIEEILDHLHPEFHKSVGKAKDIAAGAVLVACLASGVAGLYIFLPYLYYK